jgi:hypothetical protein
MNTTHALTRILLERSPNRTIELIVDIADDSVLLSVREQPVDSTCDLPSVEQLSLPLWAVPLLIEAFRQAGGSAEPALSEPVALMAPRPPQTPGRDGFGA